MALAKICKICGTEFIKKSNVSCKNWEKSKYCSNACRFKDLKFLRSIEQEEKRILAVKKMLRGLSKEEIHRRTRGIANAAKNNPNWHNGRLGNIGTKDPNWLGERAQYNAKHRWIQKYWSKTGVCEECGCTPISRGRNKFATQWSNNNHLYKRDRSDWQELCPKCHYKKDKELRK